MKHCQTCQLDFPDSFNYCRNCGSELTRLPEAAERLVYCPQCGAPTKPTWRFCRRCGSEIEEFTMGTQPAGEMPKDVSPASPPSAVTLTGAAEARTTDLPRCPRCGTTLRRQSRYCDACGTAIGTTTAQPPPAAGTAMRTTTGQPPRPTPPAARAPEPAATPTGMETLAADTPGLGPDQPSGASVLETIMLSKKERPGFNRGLVVAVVILAVVGGFFLIRAWWPQAGTEVPPTESAAASAGKALKIFPVNLSVDRIEKEDRYAGGHPHALVKLDDQALFMIRDGGRYSSAFERAQAIAANLRRAVTNLERDPQAEFRWELRAEGPTIVQVTPGLLTEPPLPIVTILREDVIGYIRRSQRKVKAKQLAQWWLDRLKDRINLFVKGQPPTLTLQDEDGQILAQLYEQAKNRSPEGRITQSGLTESFRALPSGQRQLLSYEGARIMPHHEDGP